MRKFLVALSLSTLTAIAVVIASSSSVDAQGTLGPQGDITAVTAGPGISGGATRGPATVAIDSAYTQRRVTGTCTAPNAVGTIAVDGTVTCNTTGTGDITAVNTAAGSGLVGGVASGDANLSLLTTCAAGQTLKWQDTNEDMVYLWKCAGDNDTTYGAGAGLYLFVNEYIVGAGANITVNADDVALSTNVAIGGTLSVSAGSTTVSDFRGTAISPASITGTVNDWNPTGLSTATTIVIAASGAPQITGLAGGAQGRRIRLYNDSGSNVDLVFNSASSTAANRFIVTSGTTIKRLFANQGCTIDLEYRGTFWTESGYACASMTDLSNVTLAGALTGNGNTVLGDANTDTLTINAKINSHVYYTGTAPTISACGTSPTVLGNDRRGAVTVGVAATACTITFATAWATNAPVCVITPGGGAAGWKHLYVSAVSTSAFTITPTAASSADGTDERVYYHCDGVL